jgi:hypothetical protein
MDSDKGKGSSLTPTAEEALSDAVRANFDAAVEVAKSAAGHSLVLLQGSEKKTSTRKKAKSPTRKLAKVKNSARNSRVASMAKGTRKSKED